MIVEIAHDCIVAYHSEQVKFYEDNLPPRAG